LEFIVSTIAYLFSILYYLKEISRLLSPGGDSLEMTAFYV